MKKLLYILILIIFGFVSYLSLEILSLSSGNQEKKSFDIVNDSKCNLQKSDCEVLFHKSVGKVSITPKPFYLNKKIKILITFSTALKRELDIDLKGLDMDMGYNRYKLTTTDNMKYLTSFFLPTCTKDYMPWQMAIVKKDLDKSKVNLYKFLAEKK